ncbi:imidazolonepropionase [soil metagenome]
MPDLVIRNARIVTPTRPASAPNLGRAGDAAEDLEVIPRADLTISGGLIESIKTVKPDAPPRAPKRGVTELDAAGRALLPGLVDCHTHACFAGERLAEWDDKRRGVPYLDILKRGGGIMATVRAVRAASEAQLTDLLLPRLRAMLRCGSTTIEIKSGYGLTTADELKMLRAIAAARAHFPGTLVATALLGHALDDAQPGFVGRVTRETLPAVAAEFPGITVDAFCETGAWSLEQCILLFDRARALGLPIRVHADQFNSLGMLPAALRLGARSVDHLEATTPADLELLARSTTFGVMLPICGVHLDQRFAKGRKFLHLGGRLCIATNFNPGSAPSPSLCETIAMGVRHLGLAPSEAITAATLNPAALLGFTDRGAIAVGQRADLILLNSPDERALAFQLGYPPIDHVIVNGEVVI